MDDSQDSGTQQPEVTDRQPINTKKQKEEREIGVVMLFVAIIVIILAFAL